MTTEITPARAHERPSGKMFLENIQLNLVNATWTKVLLDTIADGFTDDIEDTANHKITPGRAGYYNIVGQVCFVNIVAAKSYYASLMVNDVDWYGLVYAWGSGGTHLTVRTGDLLKLGATDYVTLWARSDSGDNTVDVTSYLYNTFLSLQRVR